MIPMNYTIFGKGANFVGTQTNNNLVGTAIAGSNKYIAGVRASNNKIYYIPDRADKVLEFDPATQATTLIGSDYGTVISGKWSGGFLAPNGKIYCFPLNHGKVLVIDPFTGTTTLIGTDYGSSTSPNTPGYGKWHGGALASNGKGYGIPRGHSQILEIDTITDTTALVGSTLSLYGEKYSYGCFTNGKIYGMPNTLNNVIVYDISTSTTSFISTPFTGSVSYKTGGCGVHTNGKIYASANQQPYMLVIDAVAGTTYTILSVGGFASIKLGKNGLIYSVPFSNNKLSELDTVSDTPTLIGTSLSLSSHYGAATGSNGKLYTVPYVDTRIEEVELLVTDIIGSDMQIPSDLSTLATSNYNRYFNNS